jgi:hypothetical protein
LQGESTFTPRQARINSFNEQPGSVASLGQFHQETTMKLANHKRILFGIAFSALSAVLFGLAFPPYHLWPLIFVGLVPMIVAQHRVMPDEFSGLASDIGVGGFLGLDWVRIVLARWRNVRSLDAVERGQAATKIILADDQAKVRSALRFLGVVR